MRGTQKPDTVGRESMVARLDRRLYEQCLEWSHVEDLPIRAIVDAILWAHFTSAHHNPHLRQMVLQRAKAIGEAIRENGRSKAEDKLPRWRKPAGKPAVPPPLQVPPAISA